MYKFFIKRLFFLLPPERAHYLAMGMLRVFCSVAPLQKLLLFLFFKQENKCLEQSLLGLKFKNPVGLAAGFDKDAHYIDGISALGFSFIELGTVTPKPQSGNEMPRLFRLPKSLALINRMGFNNKGVENMVAQLKKKRTDTSVIIGGNIGKNKITPNDSATDDYLFCFDALFNHVDYFTVNISSPNTPNLRALQEKEPLNDLLLQIQNRNNSYKIPKPILLKIAPDLTNAALDDIIEVVQQNKLNGIVATNTTISREGLMESENEISTIGAGGLSGAPLKNRATEVIRYIRNKIPNPDFVIIGVGGINNSVDAIEKLEAGANLLQIYTGFVYEGPTIAKKINSGLLDYFLKKKQNV